ncbi:ABC transporter permease [Bacillus sp. 03113]|uniref:ABC transporter permease subunit n=1 Tax=Bacillus sp. 03113 TaxID=2578211 RepID=UPI0011413B0D|nr:ABC transporter permease [Bacillus sp. 03113]
MINLVHNEMIKLVQKKRLYVIILIIAVLVPLFTYAQYKQAKSIEEKVGTADWRTQVQQGIIDMQNRLTSSRISDDWRKYLQIEIQQQQYYLDHNINPTSPGAPTFMRIFVESSIDLLLPLMVMVMASDLVSSESSAGTIKLLLTRPVNRWRILLSKYITLILSISFILFSIGLLSYAMSGLVFGYGGWTMPLLTGFSVQGEDLNTAAVHLIPLWQYILMDFGLAWFVSLIIGTLTFMLSVLLRSTAAVMGIMLASLISGAILANMVSSWESAKYLFMVNLKLTNFISGAAPPINGMTLSFSMTVLAIWGLAGLFTSFFVFTKKDFY